MAGKIDVEMVAMVRRAGPEHGREALAGGRLDLAEESPLARIAVPAGPDGHLAAIPEDERGNVEGIAEGMLGETVAVDVVAAAAAVVGDLAEPDHRLAVPGNRSGLDRVAQPAFDRVDQRTAEHGARADRDGTLGERRDPQWIGDPASAAAIDLLCRDDERRTREFVPGHAGRFRLLPPGGTLLAHEIEGATGKQRRDASDSRQIRTTTDHIAQNASTRVKEASTPWPRAVSTGRRRQRRTRVIASDIARLQREITMAGSIVGQFEGVWNDLRGRRRSVPGWRRVLIGMAIALAVAGIERPGAARAAESAPAGLDARLQAVIPSLETYVADGMKAFDVPGLAIGIVAGDRLVYAKGFGVRSRTGGMPVDAKTVFQIGSTTKGFLATTMAILADRGKLRWDDRVVDLYPDFQLKDAWVTHEFRAFDLLAQRSGLPPYVNDMLAVLGYDETALIRSLRDVEPVSSFRSTFAYTNITHLLAGRIVANLSGAANWNDVVSKELLAPLGMGDTSWTVEAIAAAQNHAEGYQPSPEGSKPAPFSPLFPYSLGGAGDLNSTVEDVAKWVRLQLGNGTFEGRRLVSDENLAVTRTPKVAINDRNFYALGWLVTQTPNGDVVWHNGGTNSFGAYIGLQLDRGLGVIVLTNQQNVGFPDAVGAWLFDRMLDNPSVDYAADKLKLLRAKFTADADTYAKPASPRPFPPLAVLAGSFVNPSLGKLTLGIEGDALILDVAATGAQLKLEPWDGDVFTVRLLPSGRFAVEAANLGELPSGFAQFQMDAAGKLGSLRLSFDGQAYDLRRE